MARNEVTIPITAVFLLEVIRTWQALEALAPRYRENVARGREDTTEKRGNEPSLSGNFLLSEDEWPNTIGIMPISLVA